MSHILSSFHYSLPDSLNPCRTELFVSIFHHLKLELLTQLSASNDENI